MPSSIADPSGARVTLEKRGITFEAKYIGETLADVIGGERQGVIYNGRLRLSLDGDLEKTLGLAGLAFHINASQLHGVGLSRFFVDNALPVSNIEAIPATRMIEAWLQQSFLQGRASVRLGKISGDREFLTTEAAKIFINNSYGWPGLFINDLPSNGPAFPFASPGVRLAFAPNEKLTLRAAVFEGDPAGPPQLGKDPDPQIRNRDGLYFAFRTPPFVIAEAEAKISPYGLDGAIKFGVWRHFGKFGDQRFGADYRSLADPDSLGVPLQKRGNGGVYIVFDQKIYDEEKASISAFLRAMNAPNDRNILSFYADGGLNFKGFVAQRPDDIFGLAAAYAGISRSVANFDRDVQFFSDPASPIRSNEIDIEATYIAQIMPGWSLQPDIQYVIRPSGHIRNPIDPTGRSNVGNAFVLGLRTIIRY